MFIADNYLCCNRLTSPKSFEIGLNMQINPKWCYNEEFENVTHINYGSFCRQQCETSTIIYVSVSTVQKYNIYCLKHVSLHVFKFGFYNIVCNPRLSQYFLSIYSYGFLVSIDAIMISTNTLHMTSIIMLPLPRKLKKKNPILCVKYR